MAPSNLQGLNLIHPESPPSNLTDAQDLLSTPIFADFASNDLDLWSTINFASDEPFVSAKDRQLKASSEAKTSADNKEAAGAPAAPAGQEPQFDFARFLADFGLNANANPDAAILSGVPGVLPNLAQANFVVPPAAVAPTPTPAPTPAARSTVSTPAPETAPAPKRARTTKTPAPAASTSSSDPSFPNPQPDTTTPLTPAEDKRRRNTAASARFRLKKKEREAALDARAHSLEERVTELERECESLRRENGWLRGLVVGVTGGVVPAMNDAPILPPATASSSSSSGSGSTPAQAGAAEKRKRDDEAT